MLKTITAMFVIAAIGFTAMPASAAMMMKHHRHHMRHHHVMHHHMMHKTY